ncbi:MAG: hypothetical protein CML29_10915 [Rhizobiales bacterium]|nr:hypothetical protein [Hyphomicrobiales bacterium]
MSDKRTMFPQDGADGGTTGRDGRRRLVLVGGGHAHLEVLRRLGLEPIAGLETVLVAKELNAPYSGMLPGLIAGTNSLDDCHVDLARLGAFAGVRVVHGEVDGIDRTARRVTISGQAPLDYDLLSLDVGITPGMAGIRGGAAHGIAVKPISGFHPKWLDLLARCLTPGGPREIAVIGAGAAGYEIAHAVRRRIMAEADARGIDGTAFGFTLVAGGSLLSGSNACARRYARSELIAAGVRLVEGDPVAEIAADRLVLKSGRELACGAAILCTPGRAAPWFTETGLPLDDDGFFAVWPTLQSTGDDAIFAAGDCAAMIGQERPKAGVFAVRQGPFLAGNIIRRAEGRAPIPYRPQRHYLALLSDAQGSAIAVRGPFALRGRLFSRWKDHIDRSFMRRYKDLL